MRGHAKSSPFHSIKGKSWFCKRPTHVHMCLLCERSYLLSQCASPSQWQCADVEMLCLDLTDLTSWLKIQNRSQRKCACRVDGRSWFILCFSSTIIISQPASSLTSRALLDQLNSVSTVYMRSLSSFSIFNPKSGNQCFKLKSQPRLYSRHCHCLDRHTERGIIECESMLSYTI